MCGWRSPDRHHARTCTVFCCGIGANGETTLLNTVAGMISGCAVVAMMETFTASQSERHATDLAMPRDARLVTAQDTEEGRHWWKAGPRL
jgi:putative DNA primase/helicase